MRAAKYAFYVALGLWVPSALFLWLLLVAAFLDPVLLGNRAVDGD